MCFLTFHFMCIICRLTQTSSRHWSSVQFTFSSFSSFFFLQIKIIIGSPHIKMFFSTFVHDRRDMGFDIQPPRTIGQDVGFFFVVVHNFQRRTNVMKTMAMMMLSIVQGCQCTCFKKSKIDERISTKCSFVKFVNRKRIS